MCDQIEYPKLRPVELFPAAKNQVWLGDSTGLASGLFRLSQPALFIVSLMDGQHSRLDIQEQFMRKFGQMLLSEELNPLIEDLDKAYFLDSPNLLAYRQQLESDYQRAPFRKLREEGGLAPDPHNLDDFLDDMLSQGGESDDRIAGFISPHLDYTRGAPCYGLSYHDLGSHTDACRFVILGTNHHGESHSIVGTRKGFETPWGIVPHDAGFMQAMDEKCGLNLCEKEYDHAREHSIELQVVLLRKALGERPFSIVPYLCPDPCGPAGTKPLDGRGVDMRAFAQHLGELIVSDPIPTCIIAGADLSHIGAFFGDSRRIDDSYLEEVRRIDHDALSAIESGDPESFRDMIAATGNQTRICGAGSIYVLATALHGRATARLRRYHQAVTHEIQNCVTCAALDFIR